MIVIAAIMSLVLLFRQHNYTSHGVKKHEHITYADIEENLGVPQRKSFQSPHLTYC